MMGQFDVKIKNHIWNGFFVSACWFFCHPKLH